MSKGVEAAIGGIVVDTIYDGKVVEASAVSDRSAMFDGDKMALSMSMSSNIIHCYCVADGLSPVTIVLGVIEWAVSVGIPVDEAFETLGMMCPLASPDGA